MTGTNICYKSAEDAEKAKTMAGGAYPNPTTPEALPAAEKKKDTTITVNARNNSPSSVSNSGNSSTGEPAPPAGVQQVVVKGSAPRRFPAWGNNILLQNGVQFYSINRSVVEAFPDLNGKHPRGHPAGTTYNQIRGVYLAEKNALAFNPSDGPYEGSGSFDIGIHETAHALDKFTGFSQSQRFDEAWKLNYYNFGLDYYLYKSSGHSESFAEGFARYFGGDKSMKKEWPAIYEYMKNLDSCMSKSGKGC